MKILPLIVLLSLLFASQAFSQRSLEKADEAFNASEYSNAVVLYKNAYTRLNNREIKARVAFNTGLCFRILGKQLHAELWLGKAVELGHQDPLIYLYYADALRTNEKFDEAIEQYSRYKELMPNDERAQKGISSCKATRQWIAKPTRYKVTNISYINSKSRDFSPSLADQEGKSIYLTTSRPGTTGDRIHGGSGENFADIFLSQIDEKGKWSLPTALPEQINTDNDEGAISMDWTNSTAYFTRCEFSKKRGKPCKILSSKQNGGSWEKPEQINITKNDTFNVVHPSISADGLTLYFVSDMPGGKGGYDIWSITRPNAEEKWGEPKNMKALNTEGNELYPYIRQDGTLFFSSDGHLGMGGLDMYRVNKNAKGEPEILNLLYPLNSPADDFGICFNPGNETGFFSSNRKDSKGGDDIYQFVLPPLFFSVSGNVVDENTGKALTDAKVKLIGSDGNSIETTTDSEGNYKFDLSAGTNYAVMSIKNGYLNSKSRLTTAGLEDDKEFELNLSMSPIDIPVEIPNVMYDVGKWELRPESIVALDQLVEIMNDNPTIKIELSSHTDYRRGSISNEELSQKRAESVVNYLISKNIPSERMVAKGYGAQQPKKINRKYSFLYPFLKEGETLSKSYIDALPANKREIAHQINRRTEFKVLSVK